MPDITQFSGTALGDPVDESHFTPSDPVLLGDVSPGEQIVTTQHYWTNTGNVDQTVTVTAQNETNVNVISVVFPSTGSNTIALGPNENARPQITYSIIEQPVGTSAPFSFELSSDWVTS